MRKFIGRYRRSPFVRNVAVVATGTALAQAVTVAATPILSRLYDPATFGILAVIISITAPISAVASWRYEVAIVLPKSDIEAANISILACLIVILMFVLTAVGVIVAGDWIAFALSSSVIAPLLWFVPLGVLFGGLNSVALHWNTRRMAYTRQSASEISRSVGTTCIQILAGLANAGAKGLVFGRVAGGALATLVLCTKIYRQDGKLIWSSFDWSCLKQLARDHDHFPKYNMPNSFLDSISSNIPAFLLAFLFDPATAGLYWFTRRLLQLPTQLIAKAIQRVFYQRAASLRQQNKDVYPILKKTTFALTAIAIGPTLIIIASGPILFEFAFGSEWREAGIYAQWLLILWLFRFSNVPSVMLIPIFGLQPFFLWYEIVGVVFRVLAISAGAFAGKAVTAIAFYSVVAGSMNLFLILYMFSYTRHHS